MKLLIIDQFKKMLKFKGYPLFLGSILAIVMLSFTTIHMILDRLDTHYDTFLAEQNVEDFHITLGQIEFQNIPSPMQKLELCFELDLILECTSLDERDPASVNNLNRIIQERIYQDPEIYHRFFEPILFEQFNLEGLNLERSVFTTFEFESFLYRIISINEHINIPLITKGELPSNLHEVAVFESFAKANSLKIGDTFTVNENSLIITGYFFTPEYISPLFGLSNINVSSKNQTLLLATEETIFSLNEPFVVKYQGVGSNDLFDETFTIQSMSNPQSRLLGRNLQMVRTFVPREFNNQIELWRVESSMAYLFSRTFVSVFFTTMFIVALFYMHRFITMQKRDIMILYELGYSKHQISLALFVLPLFLISILFFSFLLANLMSVIVFPFYGARYAMPVGSYVFPIRLFITSFIFPTLIFSIVCYFFIFSRITLSKAQKITKMRLQLKTSLYTFSKLILLAGIGLLWLTSIASFSLINNFKTHTLRGVHYNYFVLLNQFTNIDNDDIESLTSLHGKVINVNGRFIDDISIQLYGISTDSTLKRLINDDISKNRLLDDGVIITEYLANTENLELNDTIFIRVGSKTIEKIIVGIHNDLIESAVYISKSEANALMGFSDDYYNAFYALNIDDEGDYFRVYSIPSITSEITLLIRLSSQLVSFLAVIASGIVVSLIYFIILNDLRENLYFYSILKALGYQSYELYRLAFLKFWFLSSISFVLSTLLTLLFVERLRLLLKNTVGLLFPMPNITLIIVVSFIFFALLSSLVSYSAYKQFVKKDLSSLLKA